MRKTTFAFALFSLSLLLTLTTACGDDEGSSVDYTADADCTVIVAADNTYNNDIKTILNDYGCSSAGCHDATTAAEGVDLSDYAKTKNAFENKEVLCSIHHGSGCDPMPKGGSKMSNSDINKIDCWVKNGYAQ